MGDFITVKPLPDTTIKYNLELILIPPTNSGRVFRSDAQETPLRELAHSIN